VPTRYTEITAGGRCYRLDRQAKAVFKEKAELHPVTPQQLQLLEFFVSQPQHTLITKAQLYEHLYGKAAVTDDAVPLAVKSLRKALGPGFIKTAHGVGYRLVADIRNFEGDDPSPPPQPLEKFSDGDWITAALVGPERAKTLLKGAAARLNGLAEADRTVATVEGYIEDDIEKLRKRQKSATAEYYIEDDIEKLRKRQKYEVSRSEACIAGVVADILSRELENFLWNVSERPSEDVISVFRDTVKDFLAGNPQGDKSQSRPAQKSTQSNQKNSTSPASSASPRQRDAIRAERNEKLVSALKLVAGVKTAFVMQLEDHSDKGYLVSVDFDPEVQSAAEIASLIRRILDDMTPHVPFWGQLLDESEMSIGFGFAYIDEQNKVFRR
jgi:DNA-binding winged helix-turn-helix (wHTH) protein